MKASDAAVGYGAVALTPISMIVVRTAVQSIGSGWTPVSFTSAEKDLGGMAGGLPDAAFDIPAGGAGEYDILYMSTWAANDMTGTTNRGCRLLVGAAVIAVSGVLPDGSSTDTITNVIAVRRYLNAGDAVAIEAYNGSGSAKNLGAGGTLGGMFPRLSLARVAA